MGLRGGGQKGQRDPCMAASKPDWMRGVRAGVLGAALGQRTRRAKRCVRVCLEGNEINKQENNTHTFHAATADQLTLVTFPLSYLAMQATCVCLLGIGGPCPPPPEERKSADRLTGKRAVYEWQACHVHAHAHVHVHVHTHALALALCARPMGGCCLSCAMLAHCHDLCADNTLLPSGNSPPFHRLDGYDLPSLSSLARHRVLLILCRSPSSPLVGALVVPSRTPHSLSFSPPL
ncbi:hypothetical protein K437DRAFT_34050 [Tilletiaria anomala UBC 951]|uniref:Uncharacterized protein n=1 Tax=Tilletiaria anomala (strain ATCC 24038 / CBS 436.72 / UBC 951) TaxID=1037660 RepID=A0A066WNH3_TILAU|nr:uncharacterized protein K437DRAFT_34050 [Tilletiaria anomala UBC 951]KDN52175.1 hypothetical protein K437DRAFT_34050 [Tilletiaria anomala UBC 951]